MIRNIISKAQVVQDKIINYFDGFPVLSLKSYLFFVMMVFLLSGVGLFFYSIVMGVNPWFCEVTSSCFFYFVMGFLSLLVYLFLFVVKPRCHG